jgi:hypothetical protein
MSLNADQIMDFSLGRMAEMFAKNTPGVWALIQLLLDANHLVQACAMPQEQNLLGSVFSFCQFYHIFLRSTHCIMFVPKGWCCINL